MAIGGVSITRVDGQAHAHDILAIHEVCFAGDVVADINHGFWWLAWDDDEPVAFAGYYKSRRTENAIYLCRCGVLPSHRGQGLQKRLIRARLSHARRAGYTTAVTDVRDTPESANSLIRCGFKLYAPASPWGLKSSLYFRREL